MMINDDTRKLNWMKVAASKSLLKAWLADSLMFLSTKQQRFSKNDMIWCSDHLNDFLSFYPVSI